MLIGYRGGLPGDGADQGALRQALADGGCEQVVDEQHDPEDGGAQPELDGLIIGLRPGDVLVVPGLDSLGGSLPYMVRRAQQIALAGTGLRSLAEPTETIPVQNGAARKRP